MSAKKRGLGRGLDALLTTAKKAPEGEVTTDLSPEGHELQNIPIEFLRPGKYQPRKDMSEDALEELANSIKAQGIIQPIVVRQTINEGYEIIAGERRWRAEIGRASCRER